MILKNISTIVNKLSKAIYHSKDSYYKTHEIEEIVKLQDEFYKTHEEGDFAAAAAATGSMLQQRNKYTNIDDKIKKKETVCKTMAEVLNRKKRLYNIVSVLQLLPLL